ncbi:MAG: lysophospholipid acyltransferase family protein [Actinomycetota bacterium]
MDIQYVPSEREVVALEPVYNFVVYTLRPLLRTFFRWRFRGKENIPRTGPAIFACNHISYFDPLCQGYLLVQCRKRIRFFAKAELWRNPFLHFILKGAHQIPVERGSGETGPVEGALKALANGDGVIIYPEATITTNPDLTPMKGKTGAARVAIQSGAPVVPIAVWGSHWVSPKGRVKSKRLFRKVFVTAGPPMSFIEFKGRQEDPGALREVTDRIIETLDHMVRELQKEYPLGAAVPPLRQPKQPKDAQ